jgi:hypothetical protein
MGLLTFETVEGLRCLPHAPITAEAKGARIEPLAPLIRSTPDGGILDFTGLAECQELDYSELFPDSQAGMCSASNKLEEKRLSHWNKLPLASLLNKSYGPSLHFQLT